MHLHDLVALSLALAFSPSVYSPHFFIVLKIGTEVKFGATVASMFLGEHQAIETTTSINIPVLNYVVYT